MMSRPLREMFVSVVFDARKALKSLNRVEEQFEDVSKDTKHFGRLIVDTEKKVGSVSRRFGIFSKRVDSTSRSMELFRSNAAGSIASLKGLVAGAVTAAATFKTLSSTIGSAAKFEQSQVLIEAMFDDKKASDSYMKMLERVAADSPVLNSEDMFANSKSFISLSKDAKVLEHAWRTVEKLNVLDPVQGVEGAVLAMRELAGGDVVSLAERFELPKKELNAIKSLSFDKQVKALDELLGKMNITDDVIKKMGSTTVSQWNRMQEMGSIAFRKMGTQANSEVGKALTEMNDILEKGGMDKIVSTIDKMLGSTVRGVINFSKTASQYIKPVMEFFKKHEGTIKAVAVAIGSLLVVEKVIAAFKFLSMLLRANPIGLAITGIAIALEKLIGFDKIIEGIKNAFKSVTDIFKGNSSGENSLLSKLGITPDAVSQITEIGNMIKDNVGKAFSTIKQVIDPVKQIFEGIGSAVVSFVTQVIVPNIPVAKQFIQDAFTAIQPIIETVIGIFQTISNVVRALIQNVIVPLFPVVQEIISTVFKVVSPILKIIGNLFKVIGTVVMFLVNNVVVPLLPLITENIKSLWTIVKPILEELAEAFDIIASAIEWAVSKFKGFTDAVSNFKMPKLGLPKWMGGNGFIQQPDGSHATGLARVGWDGYNAILHRNESVLTAGQSEVLRTTGILNANSDGTPRIDLKPLILPQPSTTIIRESNTIREQPGVLEANSNGIPGPIGNVAPSDMNESGSNIQFSVPISVSVDGMGNGEKIIQKIKAILPNEVRGIISDIIDTEMQTL